MFFARLYRPGKRLLLSLSIIAPLLLSFQPKTIGAQKEILIPTQEMDISVDQLDPRALILRDYFAQYNSPLQYHAQDFVDAADTYNVDWKLVPAIAGVESTFGENIPGGYNGWGWGVYGDQALYFSSWRDAIFTVTKGLKQDYIDKGLTNPYSMNYVYASSPEWGSHVDYFLHDITAFSAKYPQAASLAQRPSLEDANPGQSAKLANAGQDSITQQQLAFTP